MLLYPPPQVRELFRAYLDEMIGRAGEFTEALDADVRELQVRRRGRRRAAACGCLVL